MKKIIYNLFVLTFILLASCAQDEGNYNYRAPFDIQVEGMENKYMVSAGQVIKLHPKITPADRKYEYLWTIVPAGAQNASAIDTISKEKDWEYTVNKSIGAYKLRFCAKDVQTGIFVYKEYDFSVTTEMATGWWILKGDKGETDIDFISSTGMIKADVLQSFNQKRMKGNPVDIFFTRNFWHFDKNTRRDVRTNAVFVASGEDIIAIDYFTGNILSDYEQLFKDQPRNRKVRAMFAGSSDIHVYVDSTVYTMYNSSYTVIKQFIFKSLGNYDLAPMKHSSGFTLPLLFDRKSSSFCTVNRNSPNLDFFTKGNPSPQNMNMDLLFIGGRTFSEYTPGEKALAIMKKRDTEEYQLFTMNGIPADVSKGPIEKSESLENTLQVLHADFRTLNQNNNIIYFAKNNELFTCNLDSKSEQKQNIKIPAGETITYMEFLKYSAYDDKETKFDYLVIATASGDNYRLYLHPVEANSILPAIEIYTGLGRVKRVCFMKQSSKGVINRTTLF